MSAPACSNCLRKAAARPDISRPPAPERPSSGPRRVVTLNETTVQGRGACGTAGRGSPWQPCGGANNRHLTRRPGRAHTNTYLPHAMGSHRAVQARNARNGCPHGFAARTCCRPTRPRALHDSARHHPCVGSHLVAAPLVPVPAQSRGAARTQQATCAQTALIFVTQGGDSEWNHGARATRVRDRRLGVTLATLRTGPATGTWFEDRGAHTQTHIFHTRWGRIGPFARGVRGTVAPIASLHKLAADRHTRGRCTTQHVIIHAWDRNLPRPSKHIDRIHHA